ncbi:hypothetical protein CYMTET_30688, partial [Cymbomonas tetramitiformis]
GCGDHADDDDAADDADDADDDVAADDDGAGVDGDDSLDRPSAPPPSEVQSLGTASLHAHPQRLDPDAERGGPPAPPEAAVSPGQCLKQGLRKLEWEGYALLEKMYEASLRHAGPEEDAVQKHILVHEASCFPKDIDIREGVQAESDYSGEVKLQNGRYVRHGFGVFEKFEWRIENGKEIQTLVYAYIGQFEDGKEHGHGVTLYMNDAPGTPASITIGENFEKRRGAGDLCLWLIGDYAIEKREDAPQKGAESLLYWDEQNKELYLPVRRCQAKLKKFYASDGSKVHTEFEYRGRSGEEWAKAGTAVVKAISAARVANQKRKASVDGLKEISVYEDCAFYPGSHVRILKHRELSGECATVKSAREWEAEVVVKSSGKIVALPTGCFESTEVLRLHSAAGKCYRECTCPDSGSQDHHGDGGADASVGCTTHRVRYRAGRKTLVDAGWTVQTLKAYPSGNGNHYSYTSPDGTKFTNMRGAMDHHTANASQLQPTPANSTNASQRQPSASQRSQRQPTPTPATQLRQPPASRQPGQPASQPAPANSSQRQPTPATATPATPANSSPASQLQPTPANVTPASSHASPTPATPANASQRQPTNSSQAAAPCRPLAPPGTGCDGRGRPPGGSQGGSPPPSGSALVLPAPGYDRRRRHARGSTTSQPLELPVTECDSPACLVEDKDDDDGCKKRKRRDSDVTAPHATSDAIIAEWDAVSKADFDKAFDPTDV